MLSFFTVVNRQGPSLCSGCCGHHAVAAALPAAAAALVLLWAVARCQTTDTNGDSCVVCCWGDSDRDTGAQRPAAGLCGCRVGVRVATADTCVACRQRRLPLPAQCASSHGHQRCMQASQRMCPPSVPTLTDLGWTRSHTQLLGAACELAGC